MPVILTIATAQSPLPQPVILTTANRARRPFTLAVDVPRRARLTAIRTTVQLFILASGQPGRGVLVRHLTTLDVDHTATAPAVLATPPPAIPPFPPATHITAPKERLRLFS